MKSDYLLFLEGYLDSVISLYPETTKPSKLVSDGFLERRWTSPHDKQLKTGSNMNSQPKAFLVEKSQHSGGQDDSL